jgi:hypothetical protein
LLFQAIFSTKISTLRFMIFTKVLKSQFLLLDYWIKLVWLELIQIWLDKFERCSFYWIKCALLHLYLWQYPKIPIFVIGLLKELVWLELIQIWLDNFERCSFYWIKCALLHLYLWRCQTGSKVSPLISFSKLWCITHWKENLLNAPSWTLMFTCNAQWLCIMHSLYASKRALSAAWVMLAWLNFNWQQLSKASLQFHLFIHLIVLDFYFYWV